MRIANHAGRLTLLHGGTEIDVFEASAEQFSHRIEDIFDRWDEFTAWAATVRAEHTDDAPVATDIGPVSPRPRQVIGVGLNYVDHAREAGSPLPTVPLLFTKFPSAIAAPDAEVELSGNSVDWEVELVVVIGREAVRVAQADAWKYVAGLTVGQDISDREIQLHGATPQYSFGKSFRNYAPIGPVLVTTDEIEDLDRLSLKCWIGDDLVQDGSSGDLVFSIPELIEYISAEVTLYPGDLIFTGTPAGVGLGMTPQRFLTDGDVITSSISGIGSMTNKVRARAHKVSAL